MPRLGASIPRRSAVPRHGGLGRGRGPLLSHVEGAAEVHVDQRALANDHAPHVVDELRGLGGCAEIFRQLAGIEEKPAVLRQDAAIVSAEPAGRSQMLILGRDLGVDLGVQQVFQRPERDVHGRPLPVVAVVELVNRLDRHNLLAGRAVVAGEADQVRKVGLEGRRGRRQSFGANPVDERQWSAGGVRCGFVRLPAFSQLLLQASFCLLLCRAGAGAVAIVSGRQNGFLVAGPEPASNLPRVIRAANPAETCLRCAKRTSRTAAPTPAQSPCPHTARPPS